MTLPTTVPVTGETTVYQYKMVRKITYRPALLYSYILLLAVVPMVDIVIWPIDSLLYYGAGFIIVGLTHYVMMSIFHETIMQSAQKRWIVKIKLPFIGFMPPQFMTWRIFRQTQIHLFWIGFCFVGLLSPWIPLYAIVNVATVHLWVMLPRLAVLYSLRKQSNAGLVRQNDHDFSYYHA